MKIFLIILALAFISAAYALTPAEKAKYRKISAEISRKIKKDPKNAELRIQLGFAYSKLGNSEKAMDSFKKAESLKPEKAIVHYMLGLIYEKKGMRKKAVESWRKCLRYAKDGKMRETAEKHIKFLEQ